MSQLVKVAQFYLAILVVTHFEFLIQVSHILDVLDFIHKLLALPHLDKWVGKNLFLNIVLVKEQQTWFFFAFKEDLAFTFLLPDYALEKLSVFWD